MKKAFTLIEILIVVILLGILAAVVVPQFVDQTEVVNQNAAAQEAATLSAAWQQYVAATMATGTDAEKTAMQAVSDFEGATDALLAADYIKGADADYATDKFDGFTLGFTGSGLSGQFTSAAAVASS